MTLLQILTVLRARWALALCVWLGVVALVAGTSLLRTPLYTSTGTVVLDVKSPDPIAGVVLPGMTVTTYMGTQLGVMQSDRVAQLALKALHLDTDAALQAQWKRATGGQGDYMAWLVDRTLRTLEVVPTKDSNIMSVSYTAADPVRAAAVANAFVQAFIDVTLELRVEPAKQYSSFFDDRGKHLRDELEKAQTRLSAYQQKHDIVATDQRSDVEKVRLAELSTQLVLMQELANQSGSRQSQVGANGERLSEVVTNPLVVSLNTELARQEAKLNELNEKLGNQHPQVIEMQASVSQARARLAQETRRVASSVAIDNNVNQSRLAMLRDAVEAQRAKVLRLKGQGDELAVLQRDVENAQRAYEMVQTRAAQTSVESQTTQTNVSVLKRAAPSAAPSSPRLTLHVLAAAFAGALLALAAALLRESADRRLRSATDVTRALRQPLLAVLPPRARQSGSSRLRFSSLQLRAAVARPPRVKPVAARLAPVLEPAASEAPSASARAAPGPAPLRPGPQPPVVDRAIGAFIRQVRKLDDSQIGQILRYARDRRVRFGEAAVALKLASSEDVLWALSQQFHYPYASSTLGGEGAKLNDELVAAIDPFSEQAETLRDVRSQLLMGVLAPEQGPRALAVISPQTGDGKTFFAANLAVVFSQLGGSTLLIDADLRTPRLHRLFGIDVDSGLSGILAGRNEGDVIHRVAALPSLHVLPVGTLPPNPLELLQRPVFALLIQELCGKFDHVIVDTCAASQGADARVAAAHCGAALILGRQGKSRMDSLQTLVSQVTKSRAKLAGVLMNAH